jgi:hypothetical protein
MRQSNLLRCNTLLCLLCCRSGVFSNSMPPTATNLTPSLQQQQQQQQQQGGSAVAAAKARDGSGDGGGTGGRVSISSWGSSNQLLQGGLGYRLNLLRVDGGATNNNLLMQLQVRRVWGGFRALSAGFVAEHDGAKLAPLHHRAMVPPVMYHKHAFAACSGRWQMHHLPCCRPCRAHK